MRKAPVRGRIRACAAVIAVLCAAHGADASGDAMVVRVRVLDERGKPCEDATTEVRDPGGRVLATGRWNRAARLHEVVVPFEMLRRMEDPFGPVHVAAAARACAGRYVPTHAGEQTVTILLPPRRPVTGNVRAVSGEPLVGAAVVLSTGPKSRFTPGALQARTDDAGRFAFPDAGEDAEVLFVTCPLHIGTRVRVPVSGTLEIALDPEETLAVEGQVTGAEDRKPIPGARIHRLSEEPVTADGAGRFEVTVVPKGRSLGPGQGFQSGEGTLVAEAPGCEIQSRPIRDGRADFELRRVEPLRGRVADETGPVADGTVSLFGVRDGLPTGPLYGRPLRVRTDGNGDFVFDTLPPPPFGIAASAPGRLPLWVEAGKAPERQLEVRLSRGGVVTGTVRDDSGAPLMGVAVLVLSPRSTVFPESSIFAGMSSGVRALARCHSDENGRFRLAPCPVAVPAEIYAVRGEGLRSETVRIACTAGEPAAVDLRATTRLSVKGTVTDETGRRLERVRVVLQGVGGGEARSVDSGDGSFEFENLPLGPYSLTVEEPRHARAWASAWAGESVSVVAYRKSGDAAIVLDLPGAAEGDPVVVTAVHGFIREIHFREEAAVASGKIRVGGLPLGPYVVDVLVPGFEPARMNVDVRAAENAVAVRLVRGRPLRILALPKSAVDVVTLHGRKAPDRIVADAEGKVEIFGIGPGVYRCVMREPGHLVGLVQVTLDGEVPEAAFDLRTGAAARLEVRVVGKDGAPVPDARLVLVSGEGWEFDSGLRTDPQGRASLSEVIGGTVRVVAETGDERNGNAPATIAAGGVSEVTVVVGPDSSIEESDG